MPSAADSLVSRRRLLDRLETGGAFTLVSAPAGYGKTTLIADWVRRTQSRTAWLGLSEDDDEGGRLITRLRAALGGGAAQSGGDEVALLDAIAAVREPVVLILDDYHVVRAREVHGLMRRLIDRLPETLRLVVATREDPPFGLARLRAAQRLTEIRADALAFTPEEAGTYLNQRMNLRLTAADVATLEARTEGWAAGLVLVALSLRHRTDARRFVREFAGDDRFILDYLMDEVLVRQDAGVTDFLVRTSILETMTGPLCDAVLATHGSQDVLEQLERANLFVVSLDHRRVTFRYHQLFRDLLRQRLSRLPAAEGHALHRRASRWFEANGQQRRAVDHALRAGDVDRVVHLIEGEVIPMLNHGSVTALAAELERLPDALSRERPWLCIARAWVLVNAGDLSNVTEWLTRFEQTLAVADTAGDLTPTARSDLLGHALAIRTYLVAFEGSLTEAVRIATRALQELPERNALARAFVLTVLGAARRFGGDGVGARDALEEAADLSATFDDSHVEVMVRCSLAELLRDQGDLAGAARAYRHVLPFETAEPNAQEPARTGYAYAGLAAVLAEQGAWEGAVAYARKGLAMCIAWGQRDALLIATCDAAAALHAAGDAAGAMRVIDDGVAMARDTAAWPQFHLEAARARLQVLAGDLDDVEAWAERHGLTSGADAPHLQEQVKVTLVRLLVARRREAEALPLIDRLLAWATSSGTRSASIELLCLKALTLRAVHRPDAARAALVAALATARTTGHVRVFVELGPAMASMLHDVAAGGGAEAEYAASLLTRFVGDTARPPVPDRSAVVEPLTPRELEVLRCVAEGSSNGHVARRLGITVSTVKVHTSNIYGKLAVHTRTQAVARARALGLLGDD